MPYPGFPQNNILAGGQDEGGEYAGMSEVGKLMAMLSASNGQEEKEIPTPPGLAEHFRGLGSIEFPITMYDRPSLAMSNLLLRGDAGGAVRSLFSPQSLSPEELETIRGRLTKGRKKNPILNAIMDVATNPFVIIGLALSMSYPIAGVKVTQALGRQAAEYVPKVRSWMSKLYGAQINFRDIKGMWDRLVKFSIDTMDYQTKYGTKLANDAVKYVKETAKYAPMSKELAKLTPKELAKVKRLIVGADLSDFGSLGSAGAKPWVASDMVLTPGLSKHIDPAMKGLSAKLKAGYLEMWSGPGRKKMTEMLRDMKGKGMLSGIPGKHLEAYHPRFPTLNRFELSVAKGAEGLKSYRSRISALAEGGALPGALKARLGNTLPHDSELQLLVKAGVMPKEVLATINARILGESNKVKGILYEALAKSQGLPVGTNIVKELSDDVLVSLKNTEGNLERILGGQGFEKEASNLIAKKLLAVRNNPAKLAIEIGDLGDILAQPSRYSLDAIEGADKYINSMASTWAWHGTGNREAVAAIESAGSMDKFQVAYLREELLPMMRGFKHTTAYVRGTNWKNFKFSMFKTVRDTKVGQSLPKEMRDWMLKNLSDVRGSITSESIGADMTKMFFLSTIGGNPSTAVKNLGQPLITLLNQIGAKNIVRGMGELGPKLSKYAVLRAGRMPHVEAFSKVFGDVVKTMGREPSITQSMLAGDILKEGTMMPSMARGPIEGLKKILMTPFGASETFNRLLSFYSGKQAYLAESGIVGNVAGMAKAAPKVMSEALRTGRDLLMGTQFTGGPLGLPRGLLGMWAPNRQFMHFPLKYAGWATSSLRFGKDPSKWDFGTIGRTMASSAAMYTVAKDIMGVDLSSGLMWGALPLPVFESSPFHPFPLVPPMWGVLGTGAKALYSGNTKGLGGAAAMMVPGGIAGRRAYKALSKKYADYGNRDERGRIPTYSDRGTLVGSFTPVQLMMKAAGIQSITAKGEQEMTQWLLSQRTKIRDYRRKYVEAISANNMQDAAKINEQFKKQYPQLGGIQLKKSDFKALENRRETSRINRVLKQLPKEYRPLFEYIATDASLNAATKNINMSSNMQSNFESFYSNFDKGYSPDMGSMSGMGM